MPNSVKETLEAIFNDIPRDGSNIKDDDDDDNGYENIAGISSASFEEKVLELSAKMEVVPTVKGLPVASAEPVNTEPVKSEMPKAEPIVEAVPVDTEQLLKASIAKVTEAVADPAKSVILDENDCLPQDEKGLEETTTEVKKEDETDDKECSAPMKLVVVVKPADDFLEANADGWHLTHSNQRFSEFYRGKQKAMSYLLDGGKLPFNKYEEELLDANVDPRDITYDLNTLYERMQEIQGCKVRVLEIKLRGEHQFFLWKRHMEIFRGWAARIEGAKGAAVDGVAYQHLWDWEDYWGSLEALVKKAEGVMRNLEGAYDTISRQVTIAMLQREQSGTRTEYIPEKSEPKKLEIKPVSPEQLKKFDSLDITPLTKSPKKTGGEFNWADL